jgi:hypothetical protein
VDCVIARMAIASALLGISETTAHPSIILTSWINKATDVINGNIFRQFVSLL